jgi:hypothetical protein
MTSNARRSVLALVLSLVMPAATALAAGAGPEATAEAEPRDPPGTRQERWERLRREKLAALRPPRPGLVERTLLAIEKAERPRVSEWNVAGFYPRSQSIGWGSQLALGARFWQPDLGATELDVHASAFYSIRRYEAYGLQAGFLPHRGRALPGRSVPGDDPVDFADEVPRGPGGWLGYVSLRYQHLPEVDFFGLGNRSRAEDRSTFLLQDAWYDLVLAYQPSPRATLMARGGFLQAFVGPGRDESLPTLGEVFPASALPGIDRQPDFTHVTGVALLDGRDEPGNPHAGALLGLLASRVDDRGTDAFAFHRLSADARGYLPLGSAQRVLALRALATTDRPADGAQVPFFMQQTLGGSHTLRGYPSFRFRGERLLLLQAEYRWEANPAVELALFVDAGRASSHAAGWSLEDMHTSYGAGLRIKTFDAVRFRLDVARSREMTRVLVRLGPSF